MKQFIEDMKDVISLDINKQFIDFLTKIHLLIVNEMENRKLIHKSPLSLKISFLEKYLFKIGE